MHATIQRLLIAHKKIKHKLRNLDNEDVINIGSEKIISYKNSYFKKLLYILNIKDIDLGLSYFYNSSIKGNSSSQIFFSGNFQYTIKIIKESELTTFLKIAEDYLNYMINNQNTFLVKILGCFTHVQNKNKIHFIIMKNIFSTRNIKYIYDLKGFNVDRKTDHFIKKDKDWINDRYKIDNKLCDNILENIEKDIHFLKIHNIMDYSLVISVNTIPCNKYFDREYKINKHPNSFTILKQGQYSIGIIDILTSYGEYKKIEDWFNFLCLCSLNKSCKDPEKYSERFIKNIYNNLFQKK